MPMRLFVLFVSTLALAGCKQGLGERCQVDSDCKMPLICVSATNTCQDGLGTTIDAPLPIDAPIDAPPIDAPIDAMIDAT
jgi:hypothetical protein